MRFGSFSRRTLLQTALAALIALGIPALTFGQGKGNGGGGGGGGDDGGDPTPPPVTYMITWMDGFVGNGNEAGDLMGDALVGGVWQDAVFYEGSVYLLDDLFAGTGASPRSFYDMSERTSSAGIYLCGSCTTSEGIRGFRLLAQPNSNGALERAEIAYASPPAGDDQTTLNNVNSYGQAVGQSRLSITNERQVIYLASDGTTTAFFDEGSPQGLTESGVCVFLDRSGISNPYPAYKWSPGGMPTPILANVNWVSDINECVDVIGRQRVVEGSGKKSQTVDYNFILTDQLFQEAPGYRRTFEGTNDFNDVVVRDVVQGGRNSPDRVVGSVIFGDTGLEFTIDEMLDSSNSDLDILRYLDSSVSVNDIKNAGVIIGVAKPLGASENNATVILTPVVTP